VNQHREVLQAIYDNFNARDIEGVLAALRPDVLWANGMDGGHEHGIDAVRAYWTRQWALVQPTVKPLGFEGVGNDAVLVTVEQTVRDLDGKPLAGQDHGLHDKLVGHRFQFRDGRVARFDITEL